MEVIKNVLFSSPSQLTLEYLLQNADLEFTDSQITKEISGAKRAAIHQALRRLAAQGIIHRQHRGRRCVNRLVQELSWIAPLKIVSNILRLDPFLARIKNVATKVILFGSRATGSNRHDSDYDVLVISMFPEAVVKAAGEVLPAARLQLLIKSPEELLDFDAREPVLAENIRKGVVLWEK